MLDEHILREKARQAMQAGRMPRQRPSYLWGARAVGAPCAVCGGREEMEFEVQWSRDGRRSWLADYHVHLECFTAWELEIERYAERGPSAVFSPSAARST